MAYIYCSPTTPQRHGPVSAPHMAFQVFKRPGPFIWPACRPRLVPEQNSWSSSVFVYDIFSSV